MRSSSPTSCFELARYSSKAMWKIIECQRDWNKHESQQVSASGFSKFLCGKLILLLEATAPDCRRARDLRHLPVDALLGKVAGGGDGRDAGQSWLIFTAKGDWGASSIAPASAGESPPRRGDLERDREREGEHRSREGVGAASSRGPSRCCVVGPGTAAGLAVAMPTSSPFPWSGEAGGVGGGRCLPNKRRIIGRIIFRPRHPFDRHRGRRPKIR
mmetsp:Transcript_78917/g.228108  ORF Transcript_78917/g.228108 Transcript_78917/m.228108 type:complete len:215 (-) Transcript_78917:16-660(-)